MDRTLRNLGVKGEDQAEKPSAVQQLLGGDTSEGRAKGQQPRTPRTPRP